MKTITFYKRRSHAIKRAMERFGILVSNEMYERMIDMIQKKESTPLLKVSGTKSFHRIQLEEETFTVLYSKATKSIITFYHNGWIHKDKTGQWRVKSKSLSRKMAA